MDDLGTRLSGKYSRSKLKSGREEEEARL